MSRPEGFEFRPVNDNEMAQLIRLANYVFAEPPTEDEPPPLLDPAWSQCAFKGDQLAAISGAYPFIVRLNGRTAKLHGVTMVGTEPEFRRRGLVRQLIADLLHRGKEEGQVGSILLASMGAIYQRFGYGLASKQLSYELDPREAQFQESVEITGRMQRMTKEEATPLVKSVYKSYAKDRNMLALRADGVWERFLADLGKEKAYCAVHFDANNEPDGYCIYTTKWAQTTELRPPQDLSVNDFAYTSMNAYRALWQFLCSHDLVGRIDWRNVAEDDPAEGILLEPRCLHTKSNDALWFRVIDVAGLLQARGYDVDGDIIVKVEGDDLCPWNNGTYALSVRDGIGNVEAVTNKEADITCSINGLASLAAGYASVTWLDRIGRIRVTHPKQSGYYNQLFSARYRPALSFGF